MAVPYTREAWVQEVTSSRYIPEAWTFLKTIREGELIKEILPRVYDRYIGEEGGTWTASPHWTQMFEWTKHCAPRKIRAIVVLMEPLPPGGENSSTGMALGVGVPKDATTWDVPTVRNFLLILDGLYHNVNSNGGHAAADAGSTSKQPTDPLQKCTTYHEKRLKNWMFDPQELSGQGFLFFNIALTRGDPKRDERYGPDLSRTRSYDVYNIWLDFMIEVLKELLPKPDSEEDRQVVLFQFYRDADDTIGSAVRCTNDTDYRPNLRYIKIRPDFLQSGAAKMCAHLAYFNDEHRETYIREVMKIQTYLKLPYSLNRKVAAEIAEDKERNMASYTASEIERAVIKKIRKKEKRQEKSFIKLGNAFKSAVDILITHLVKYTVPQELDVAS